MAEGAAKEGRPRRWKKPRHRCGRMWNIRSTLYSERIYSGIGKVRYRGLAKNGQQLYILFRTLANLVIGSRTVTTVKKRAARPSVAAKNRRQNRWHCVE